MEFLFDTCNGFGTSSCVWKGWSFTTSFIGFLWQYMTIVYIICASSISNVHKGIASGSQCTSQHQHVNHKLFNIVFQTVKRISCEGNKEKTQFEYKKYSHNRPKEPIMYASFKEYINPPEFPTFDNCNEFVNKWATKQQDSRLTHGFHLPSGKLIFKKLYAIVFKINSHHSLNVSMLYMIFLHLIYFSCVHANIWFSWEFWRWILEMYKT